MIIYKVCINFEGGIVWIKKYFYINKEALEYRTQKLSDIQETLDLKWNETEV